MKNNRLVWFTAITLILIYGVIMDSDAFKKADFFVFDLQSKYLTEQLAADSDILVIAIDDYSLDKMQPLAGKWSWPRSVYGQVLEYLQQGKVSAIVFDILFADKDSYRPDDDAYFNEVLAQTQDVFFPTLILDAPIGSGVLLKQLPNEFPIAKSATAQENAQANFILPLAIEKHYWQLGTINFNAEMDGVGRYYQLKRNIQGWKINSLPMTVVGALGAELPKQEQVLLQWRGHSQKPFKTVSFVSLFQAAINDDQDFLSTLDNKILLIGATASGLYDDRATPINNHLPGVYILATAIDNLKNQRFLAQASSINQFFLSMALIILISLCFYLNNSYQRQLSFALITLITLCLLTWQVNLSLMLAQYSIFIGSAMVFASGAYLLLALLFGYREYQQRQQTIAMFGRFLHPKMVKQLLTDNESPLDKLNKKQQVTVIFSDIRNFTQLSESRSAEEVFALLNDYFDKQLKVIFKHQGTLDKFIGDCVMAFWGAPIKNDNHALSALKTALAMEQQLITFKQSLDEDLAHFDIGIGIHTDECLVGLIGTSTRLDYTVIGDGVNLASRIEGLTKNTSRILVSEQTKKLTEHVYEFDYKGEYHVKGRAQSVKLYTPIKLK